MFKAMLKFAVALAAALFASPGAQAAQDYPGKPITMVVPFAPGGTVNLMGRLLANRMSEALGQTVIVDLAPAAPTLDEIVVTSARLTEPRSAIVSTNVTPAQIESLPQNDRNFLNFAALAPGVSVSPSAGNRSIQAGGVSADKGCQPA